ncbi:hypothetical protein GCM10010525_07230 [Glutamicibacter bergerei]
MCQKLQVSRASYYRWLNPCEELSEAKALRMRRTELVHYNAKTYTAAVQLVARLATGASTLNRTVAAEEEERWAFRR